MATTNKRPGYTVVCQKCGKTIMKTRNRKIPRPARFGLCGICKPQGNWNHRLAPWTE